MNRRRRTFGMGALLAVWTMSSIVFALMMSWLVLMQSNFLYPIWHDFGGIGAGIDTYGPKNRFKPGFGDTTKAQRSELFGEINRAVHNHGEGLARITYKTQSSGGEQRLLHEAEIVHLQDVANLIDQVFVAAVAGSMVFLLISAYLWRSKNIALTWRAQGAGIAGLMLCVALVLLVFGAEDVFNQLHIWVFPDNHQWFFYYQESLMSTLMLAPTLFGWIAAALAVLALLFWVGLVQICIYAQQRKMRP